MKTILWANEMSGLATGYATYGREVMKRLFATNKYKIYEFATYGHPFDSRFIFPWGYYPNLPEPQNKKDNELYNSDPTNQFGKYRFNDVLLDCKPDCVIDIRDHWMLSYQNMSPFRNLFHWAIMPTVDAEPQDEPWIADFADADSVCTYSDFGFDTLKKQGNNRIKLFKTTPPGVNIEIFKPVANRKSFRKSIGFSDDVFIIGTVMRNQKRKLYPDLIESFKLYLEQCKNSGYKELADKSYLYIHSSHPDVGWDIPYLIKEFGVGNKVLLTYRCTKCGHVFPSYFQDCVTYCRMCGQKSASMPSVNVGVSDKSLVEIYNLFDVYVQYANSEGFGMPQVEAAACGVPVFATDYSAMSDVVRKLKGFPINVQRFYYESETGCKRALPDNQDFVNKLIKYATNPVALQQKRCADARRSVECNYTWDKTARLWEELLDSIPERNQDRWINKPKLFNIPNGYPGGLNNEEFVNWCYTNVLNQPEKIGEYKYFKAINDLNYQHVLVSRGGHMFSEGSNFALEPKWQTVTQDVLFNHYCRIRNDINYWEQKRVGIIQDKPQFLKYARKPYA